jgi:enoyl-CoA hydratase
MNSALRAAVELFLIDPSQGWSGAVEAWQPLVCVDLDQCDGSVTFKSLPPVPVIGIGDRAHPVATMLDAVIEPPIDAATLVRQVQRAPRAAAVITQLLRSLEGLPVDRALTLESFCFGMLQGSQEYATWLASRTPSTCDRIPGKVTIERRESEVHIVLDRPQARNAINREIRDQLFEAFALAALDPEIRSVNLRSTGEAFSAGGDLDEFGTTRDPAMAHLIRSRTLPAVALARCADIVDVHVQGACIGAGVELSALARRVTAAPSAWFQLPELAMGLLPGAGGCVSVPRRIGRQRAMLMILSGQPIDAETALRWGLIDAIEADG